MLDARDLAVDTGWFLYLRVLFPVLAAGTIALGVFIALRALGVA
jgi:ABC-type transport system involved in cytochrome bd biosynthesis fused ATPase/permease subunit